jgi:hypothetical protein
MITYKKTYRQQAEVIKIMKMKMFATLDKARPHTENIRGSNLAAVLFCVIISPTEIAAPSE